MSFKTLKLLSQRTLPVVLSDPRHVCALKTLHEAGLIKATFLPESASGACGAPQATVVVANITALGWMMIHAFPNDEPPSGWLGATQETPIAEQL